MTKFHLPDVGEGLREAEIVAWHVSPGDRVVADQPLLSIETDKAVVEIPSPQSGRVTALFGDVGDIIEVGAELAEFETGAGSDAGAIVGDLPAPSKSTAEAARAPRSGSAVPGRRKKVTPAVRALAERLKVDIQSIEGTGPQGAITTRDVQAASASGKSEGRLRGARRGMARTMSRAGREVVPATIQDVAAIDSWPQDTDPTTRLIRAILVAVAAEPKLNAHFDGDRLELVPKDRLSLGLAFDTSDGLFVPVIESPESMDDEALKVRIDDLKQAVRDRSAKPGQLSGQSFTLSNFGMIAGRHVTLVVVPPQVAILGAGRISDRPAVIGGKVAVSRQLPLSLTFDHRAISGAEAARFLAALISDLECEATKAASGHHRT